jgi:hypothetical protein
MALPLAKMRVTAKELRTKFNEGKYLDRVKSGEFSPHIGYEGHPSPPKSGQVFCTRSQFISYYDAEHNKVFSVHQYLCPDGSIGGSGTPDPKELRIDDTIYFV